MFFFHYFPYANHWIFSHILGKELYIVIEEVESKRFQFVAEAFKGQKIKYLKVMHG